MEHRSDADMGPEVLRIGRDREKGVGCCSKQDAIDDRLVLISDIGNLLWQTTWKYGTGSKSASRAASHSRAVAPWHFGQCRLRQEL